MATSLLQAVLTKNAKSAEEKLFENLIEVLQSVLLWPTPWPWSLKNTMRPSENTGEKACPLMSPDCPSPPL